MILDCGLIDMEELQAKLIMSALADKAAFREIALQKVKIQQKNIF